jgi:hypothetical protein
MGNTNCLDLSLSLSLSFFFSFLFLIPRVFIGTAGSRILIAELQARRRQVNVMHIFPRLFNVTEVVSQNTRLMKYSDKFNVWHSAYNYLQAYWRLSPVN